LSHEVDVIWMEGMAKSKTSRDWWGFSKLLRGVKHLAKIVQGKSLGLGWEFGWINSKSLGLSLSSSWFVSLLLIFFFWLQLLVFSFNFLFCLQLLVFSSTSCFAFNSLSSLQLLVLPLVPCLLFNFFSMVLIWENFYAIVSDGVVKYLEEFWVRWNW
jgi:hypothetical protein